MSENARNYWKHRVRQVPDQTRIVDYCGLVFSVLGSKSATKKSIARGLLFLNGKKANTAAFVHKGDLIELRGQMVEPIRRYKMELQVVYSDDHLIIVNKPGGIAVNGNRYKTVENVLSKVNRSNPQRDALVRPVAVHRIDVPTCGLVMLAKTKTAQIRLSQAFQRNQVQKQYMALVHGLPPARGSVDEPVHGKKARTNFTTIRSVPSDNFGHLSLVKLQPITGRTHQLRIHLKKYGASHCWR